MRTIPILFTLALLLAACGTQGDAPGTGDDASAGDVTLLLTDAPTDDAEWLRVDFGRIELVPSDEDDGGIVVLSEEAGTIENLLELDNGETHALASAAEVPDGTYEQIRLVVDEVTLAFPDGEGGVIEQDVKCPSCAQSGLKIAVEPALLVEGGESSQVVLDFDAAKAVHRAGKSGKLILKPTALRAVSVSGVLEGRVENAVGDPLAGATVAVYEGTVDEGEEPLVSARTEADGSYRIITLLEGDYTVVVSAAGHETTTVGAVTIAANETTTLEPTVLAEITVGALEGVAVAEAADGSTAPLAGASVSVYEGTIETGEAPVEETVTGADGAFGFDTLPVGAYTVVAAAEGHVAATVADVAVAAGETTVLAEVALPVVAVEATGTLAGTVATLDGTLVADANVLVYEGEVEPGELPVDETYTDADGAFTVDALAAGSYTVVVEAVGFDTATALDVEVTADATETVEVTLEEIVVEVVEGAA